MTVLVAYASRHGSTAGIAERIAATMTESGVATEARSVDDVDDAAVYDAFVIGSAAYMYRWLKEATTFVRRNRDLLAARPVWLFSSGPLGTDLVDEQGRDIFSAMRPKEFDELGPLIHPRGENVFFGAWDPDAPPVGLAERSMRLLPKAREAIPAWARAIAGELRTASLSRSAPAG